MGRNTEKFVYGIIAVVAFLVAMYLLVSAFINSSFFDGILSLFYFLCFCFVLPVLLSKKD